MSNSIAPTAILGNIKLKNNIFIGNHSVIGTQPQHIKFNKKFLLQNKFKALLIEENVIIMDLCHIHAGIKRNTKIGRASMIMSGTHIGHDVHIGEDCNVSPNVALAGEVTIKNSVTIGMGSTLHQGIKVGSYSMIGMGAVIIDNVPPFGTFAGVPAKMIKINEIKLKRLGVSKKLIDLIRNVLIDKKPLKKIKLKKSDQKYYKILDQWINKKKIN